MKDVQDKFVKKGKTPAHTCTNPFLQKSKRRERERAVRIRSITVAIGMKFLFQPHTHKGCFRVRGLKGGYTENPV
jgi:hypothetical protein